MAMPNTVSNPVNMWEKGMPTQSRLGITSLTAVYDDSTNNH